MPSVPSQPQPYSIKLSTHSLFQRWQGVPCFGKPLQVFVPVYASWSGLHLSRPEQFSFKMFVHCLGQPDEGSLLWLDLYLPKSCSCTGLWLIAQYCPKQCSIKMSGHWYLGIGQSTGLGLATSTVPSLPSKASSIPSKCLPTVYLG